VNLTDAELDRYARHIVLPQVGGFGQRRLKETRVVVVGAGGIGSAVIPSLAGAGIGQLTIIDDDVVELANLHRQPLFRERDVGYSKADLAVQFAHRLNGHIQAKPILQRIGTDNAEQLLDGHDLVIDGSDNFATRLAVSDACVKLGLPLLSAAAVQFQGQVGLFRSKPCYRCFVGDAFDADDCDTCAEDGVLGAMAGWVGTFAVLQAIRVLLGPVGGLGDPQWGKLHVLDGLAPSFRTMTIAKDPACSGCSKGAR